MQDPSLRLVIVNDSATLRASLRAALAGAEDMVVVGEAADGAQAVSVVSATRPSVVLMDIVMPRMDGYAATRQIMATAPTPIVLVSSVVNPRDIQVAMEALRCGALAIVEALPSPNDPAYMFRRDALFHTIRSMANVKMPTRAPEPPSPLHAPHANAPADVAAVGLAASTGGPNAIVEVLRMLPKGVSPPILIVQHIGRGFAEGFARWLTDTTGHPAKLATDGELVHRGGVYVAPDERHLGLDAGLRVVLSDAPAVGLFRPSCTWLLRSLAASLGRRARAVILTGMGDDGADGAVALRRAGGRVAAQDEATSVVYGMPCAAWERGGVDDVLPLGAIADWICARSAP